MEYKDNCGTCLYCRQQEGEYICTCEESDFYACEVLLDTGCDEHVRKNYGSRE